MATCNTFFLLIALLNSVSFSTQRTHHSKDLSLSFPLTPVPCSHLHSSPASRRDPYGSSKASSPYNYRSPFRYSMALVASLPIGTPSQPQQMVLDTGSQLSWIQCHDRTAPRRPPNPPTASFDPSLSSSFSALPCNHPLCKPRIPDFTLPTSCDQNRLCHYSYFYADGTLAEGNLVREKITFSGSQSTPPLILGCAAGSSEAEGILGMNLGRLSFTSQAKITRFSYCVPVHKTSDQIKPSGMFYLGENPNSRSFRYIDMLTFPDSQRMPNFDRLAYTVRLSGIRIGARKLNVSASAFLPDAGGSGQTIIDSGTQYMFLVDEAYAKVREEVARLAGPKLKKGYVYQGSLDMCFDGNVADIGRLIGEVALEFEKGVEIVIEEDRVLDGVAPGVSCLGIGRSDWLGIPGNIIGNFFQQNLWVEYDIGGRRVGFGKSECT